MMVAIRIARSLNKNNQELLLVVITAGLTGTWQLI